jgi:predicted aminopeptidase
MRRVLLVLLLPLLGGCASLGYYGQTLGGHFGVMQRRVSLDRAIADPDIKPATRERLQQVAQIRRFAVSELGLPDNDSYRSYADLERPFALWNVFAAPEFELKALQSCFPLVGCLSYRGYYSEVDARSHAAELQRQGHDVYVGGVAAYSTLGWFADPVLNTMLRWSKTELAGVIFHELAHQKLYVRDDSSFNESFATAVQEEGLRRWLDQLDDEPLRASAVAEARRREDFVRLVQATRKRLQQLYASGQAPEQMRVAKAQVFESMRAEYAQLRALWGGHSGYDSWFGADLNNAKLLAVATYHEWVPAFRALLWDAGGDLDRFYADAELAARLPVAVRRRWLSSWQAGYEKP